MADVKGRSSSTLKRKHEIKEKEGTVVEKPTVFSCELCTATFVTEISLARHMMMLHEDDQQVDPKEDACQLEAMYIFDTILESGSVSMSPDVSTPAKIPNLQKTFKPVPNLNPLPLLIPLQEFDLAQAHAQTKTHRCDLCSVYFGKKEDLARHVTRTHGGARFTCPHCYRNISRRDHLKRHIKNVHPEICTDTEIGPFLADHNVSRVAKELHAENFIAQYEVPSAPPSLMNLSNYSQHLYMSPQPEQQYVQVQDDLYYERDEEFKGEDPEASDEGLQQITIQPALPLPDDFDASESETYREDNSDYQEQGLFHMPRLIVQNPTLSSNEDPADAQIKLASERKYKCDMCGAAFISMINLQRHISTHSIIPPHKCLLCSKGFLRKEHLTKHLSSVHFGMKFTCQFCEKDISRKDHLLRHIRNCHPVEFIGLTPRMSYISCDVCFKNFNHIDELHEHQSSVHSDVRKYKCPKCQKAFKRKEHLVQHEVIHSGEKKFGCSICWKAFPRKGSVDDHIRRVHSQAAPLSNYPCDLCDNVFQQQAHLRQHLKTYHGVSTNNYDDFRNFGPNGVAAGQNHLKDSISNNPLLGDPLLSLSSI